MTRHLRSAVASACLTTALVASSGHALAQQSPTVSAENRALAETMFFAGRGLMDAGRFTDACLKFQESYRLDQAAGTLLNLAVCHEKEGRIASAWGEFRQALAEAEKSGRADRQTLVREHLSAIVPELPMLTIEVPPATKVPGLEVLRNGVPLMSAAWSTELPVDPGTVTIETRAPGYKPRTATLVVERKEKKSFSIDALELAPIVVAVGRTEKVWSTKKKVGLGGIVGGGLFLAGGVVMGILALDAKKSSDRSCALFDGERRCDQAGVSAMGEANTFAWLSNGGIVLGALGAGVGAYLFATGGEVERPTRAALTWRVTPLAGGAQGTLVGSF